LDTVIKQIISLFIVILIGFYGGKKNIIDETITNGLSKLLLEITTPLLIISSFSFKFTSEIETNVLKAFIYGLIIFIVTPLLVKPLLIKVEKGKRNILQFAMVFSNCGFMGFPIVQSVFGDEGVIYAAIFNMIFNIFVWTYGVMLFSDKRNIKDVMKIIKNPGIISALIGILIMVFSINIPSIVLDTMKMVGGLTTPVSMLIIGSLLSRTELKKLFNDKSLYYGSFIKLLCIPIALFLGAKFLKESSLVIKTFILLQAMPAGAMTSLFAENFNREKEYSALVVSFSTLISVITIPLIIKFCF
jgi:predicted permease